jgi:hypothetical protein
MPYTTGNVKGTGALNKYRGPGGELNLGAMERGLQDVVRLVREPIIPDVDMNARVGGGPSMDRLNPVTGALKRSQGGMEKAGGMMVEGAKADMGAEAESLGRRAEMQATGLEMKGAMTLDLMRRAREFGEKIEGKVGKASEYWDTVVAKGDEYVKQSYKRMRDVLAAFDDAVLDWKRDVQGWLKNSINAQVTGMRSAFDETKRDIVSMYGADSAEYEQFKQTKIRSVGAAIAQLQAQGGLMMSQMRGAMAEARGGIGTAMAGQAGKAEGEHLGVMAQKALAEQQYGLQMNELKMREMQFEEYLGEGFINSMTGASIMRLETLPYVSLIADVIESLTPRYTVQQYGMPGAMRPAQAVQGQQQQGARGQGQGTQRQPQQTQVQPQAARAMQATPATGAGIPLAAGGGVDYRKLMG